MRIAKMPASSADHFSHDRPSALFLSARLSRASIRLVMLLEFSTLTVQVAIVGHRVAAEVDSFFKSLLHCGEHQPDLFFRNCFEFRFRMHASSPKNFVGIDVANARN